MAKRGPKPGSQHKASIAKEQARELTRAIITRELEPLLAAQLANAKGLKYLVTRDKKTGKFIRVTEAMARAKAGPTEEVIEVWEKDPSVQAFTDLLNRALDKPKEQVQEILVEGLEERKARLNAARQRVEQSGGDREKS